MYDELLTWFGNALTFFILIYLILNSMYTNQFNLSTSLTAAFGLGVSILIQLRNLIK